MVQRGLTVGAQESKKKKKKKGETKNPSNNLVISQTRQEALHMQPALAIKPLNLHFFAHILS